MDRSTSDHLGTSDDVANMYTAYPFFQQRARPRIWKQFATAITRWADRARVRIRKPADSVLDPVPHLDLDVLFAHFSIPSKPCLVLDAGCGSGWVSAHLATCHPHHRVFGIDLVDAHIQRCRHVYGHLPNLRFEHADITKLDVLALGGIENFDVVISTGVLHHMPDPSAGLAALRRRMNKPALMLLYLYDAYARHPAHLLRRAVYMLDDGDPPAQRLELAHMLLEAVRGTERYAQLRHEDMSLKADAVLADTFTHPIERTFTLPQVRALLAEQDLEILGFFDFHRKRERKDPLLDHRYFLNQLATSMTAQRRTMFLRRVARLPELDRVHLVSLLCDRHTFDGLTVVCGVQGMHRPRVLT